MRTILNISQNHYVRGGSDRYFFTLAELLEKYGQRQALTTNHLNGTVISRAAQILNVRVRVIYCAFYIHAMPLNLFSGC